MVNSNVNALGVIFANTYDNLVPELVAVQIVLSYIFCDCLVLFRIEGAAIYDDALGGVVADHVAVFLQHVDLESFDM